MIGCGGVGCGRACLVGLGLEVRFRLIDYGLVMLYDRVWSVRVW
jgi:hypothetical protein